ncbi:MAG: tetratricopeptide repeat protein [Gemmatimonadota bacterium]|nr:MAG: tetratricopeptide repeat protein [Gemmatimonadota bacterium]
MNEAERRHARSLAESGDWQGLVEALEALEPAVLADDPSLAYRYGEALYHTGRMRRLARFARAYETAARGRADMRDVMQATNLRGIAAFELGDTEEARVAFDMLMELAEGEQDQEMLARAANNLGAIANLRGRRHEALAYYSMAIPLYQRLGQARGLAQTHHNMGLSYRDLGRLGDAADAYARAVELAAAIPYRPLVAMSMIGRAEVALGLEDIDLSLCLLDRGLDLSRAVADPISEAEGLRVRGLARTKQVRTFAGAGERARADFGAALDLARTTGSRLLEAEIERDLGRLWVELGEPREAEPLFRASRRTFEEIGAVAEAGAVDQQLQAIA